MNDFRASISKNVKIYKIHTPFATLYVAQLQDNYVHYCYGGTRLVSPELPVVEIHRILKKLTIEESECKNRLINIAIPNLRIEYDRLPKEFSKSKVGGARCIIQPINKDIYELLLNPENEKFESCIQGIFRELGDWLNKRKGIIKLTPDFGKYAGLADLLHTYTENVLGIACNKGGCGGKSSYSAHGVITALEYLVSNYRELPITLIGANGSMGGYILNFLQESQANDIAVCDLAYTRKEVHAPLGCQLLPAEPRKFTDECLKRGGVIIATTYGEELENSNLRSIPSNSILIMAHNLSIPSGAKGLNLTRNLYDRNIVVINGQILTLGGALTSRLEWYSRLNGIKDFNKPLAFELVTTVTQYLCQLIRNNSMPFFHSMLHILKNGANL